MTWVIGRSGPFGNAVGLSDIRVTLADGTEHDCLQKIYPVGPIIALGFAGSVAIGFAMANALAMILQPDEPGVGWDPTVVAEWWPADARRIYEAAPESERTLQSHLMMLGAHPNEDIGFGLERCYVYRFLSPDFVAELAPPTEIVSIGSGADIGRYADALRELGDNRELFGLDVGGMPIGIAGVAMMHSIARVIEESPAPGISRHLHICLVRRNGIRLGNNDVEWTDREDRVVSKLTMPPVARNLAELTALLTQGGLSVAGAKC